jgi:hypothetical protein
MRLVIKIKKEDGFYDADLEDVEGVPLCGVSHKSVETFKELVSAIVINQALSILGE